MELSVLVTEPENEVHRVGNAHVVASEYGVVTTIAVDDGQELVQKELIGAFGGLFPEDGLVCLVNRRR